MCAQDEEPEVSFNHRRLDSSLAMQEANRVKDVRISWMTDDMKKPTRSWKKLVKQLERIYRQRALLIMARFSRGSVLIQHGKVLTDEMVDSHFRSKS